MKSPLAIMTVYSVACRVAGGGLPPPALTEPDLWASHPALQVGISNPGNVRWIGTFGLAYRSLRAFFRLKRRA